MRLSQKVAVNAASQVFAQLAASAAGLVSVAATARYLSVREYGAVLSAMVLVGLFQIGTDLGVTAGGAREMAKRPADVDRIAWSVLLVSGGLTVLVVPLIYLIGQVAYPGAGNNLTREVLAIMLVPLLLTPIRSVTQARITFRQKAYVSALCSVAARAVGVGLVLLVIAERMGPVAIAVAYSVGNAAATLLVCVFVRESFSFVRRWDARMTKALILFAGPLGLVLILNTVYYRLDSFLLSIMDGKSSVAMYAVSYKVVDILIGLPSYFMVTLFPELAKRDPRSAEAKSIMGKALTGMWLLSLPLLAFGLYSSEILHVIGGGKYAGAALTLQLMLISVVFAFMQQVFGNALVAQGKQGALMWNSLLVLLGNLALNVALIPAFGTNGAASALVATELLSLCLTLVIYARTAGLPPVHSPQRAVGAFAALVAVLALRYVPGFPLHNPFLIVLFGAVLGLPVYVWALIRLGALPPFVSALASSWAAPLRARVGAGRRRVRTAAADQAQL